MRSLSMHLQQSEAHGQLPFHPGCPICQQTRLAGTLATGGIVSARTQAVLAASLLALSTAAPAATAFAAEQDQEQDGTAPVAQTAPDSADNPDFDPGGDSSALPNNAPPVPQTQAPADAGSDDTAPVDQAPATNPSDPVVDTGDGSDTSTTPATTTGPSQPSSPTSAQSTPPTAPVTPPAAAGDPAPTATSAPSPATQTPAPELAVRARDPLKKATRHAHHAHVQLPRREGASRPVSSVTPAPTNAASATSPSQIVAPEPTAVVAVSHGAKPGDGTHTVQPGESLWLIASDVLGGDASPARVAREVHRLWQLNRDRIGTGDPDLLMVGTRLELR